MTQEEVEAVCEKANAHGFISNWPNGYDTMVGERGVKLSGGQKQRLVMSDETIVHVVAFTPFLTLVSSRDLLW